MVDENHLIDDAEFDEWFSSLGPERRAVLKRRISKAAERVESEEEFMEEAGTILTNMFVRDVLEDLVAQGYARHAGVDNDGEIMYAVTPEGRRMLGEDTEA